MSRELKKKVNGILKNHKIVTIIVFFCILITVVLPINIISKLFIIAANLNLYIFTIYFGNFFNPASLFISLFLLMIGCSQMKLIAIEQNNFSTMTWLTIISVIIFFYATMFIYLKISKNKIVLTKLSKEYYFCNKTILMANIILLLIEIATYIYALSKLGGIPLFNDFLRANIMTKVLGNWLLTFMVLPGILAILDVIYITQTKKYGYFIFIFIFISMITLLGGRINIFIPIITTLFYLLIIYYTQIKKATLFIVIGALLTIVFVLMIIIPLIRTGIYSGSGTQYYEAISKDVKTDKEDMMEQEQNENSEDNEIKLPSELMSVWINLSTEMHGFDWMVKELSRTNEFQYGRMFLLGPLNFICKYFIKAPTVDVLKYDWLNVLTFMQKPYMDFGILGVIAFIIIYTFVGMVAYNKALNSKSIFAKIFYSYFCMSTMFFVFENHFYYVTFMVNILLLWLGLISLSVDWVAKLSKLLIFRKKN